MLLQAIWNCQNTPQQELCGLFIWKTVLCYQKEGWTTTEIIYSADSETEYISWQSDIKKILGKNQEWKVGAGALIIDTLLERTGLALLFPTSADSNWEMTVVFGFGGLTENEMREFLQWACQMIADR